MNIFQQTAAAFKIPVGLPKKELPSVNRVISPFGQTQFATRQGGFGSPLQHPTDHDVIQHPNILHGPRDGASPFIESAGAANAYAGRARNHPPFSAPGLARITRK